MNKEWSVNGFLLKNRAFAPSEQERFLVEPLRPVNPGKIAIISDLHLTDEPNPVMEALVAELSQYDAVIGNGDLFESKFGLTHEQILSRWGDALQSIPFFASTHGNHDPLSIDEEETRTVAERSVGSIGDIIYLLSGNCIHRIAHGHREVLNIHDSQRLEELPYAYQHFNKKIITFISKHKPSIYGFLAGERLNGKATLKMQEYFKNGIIDRELEHLGVDLIQREQEFGPLQYVIHNGHTHTKGAYRVLRYQRDAWLVNSGYMHPTGCSFTEIDTVHNSYCIRDIRLD